MRLHLDTVNFTVSFLPSTKSLLQIPKRGRKKKESHKLNLTKHEMVQSLDRTTGAPGSHLALLAPICWVLLLPDQ
jgi:hypothetical protein